MGSSDQIKAYPTKIVRFIFSDDGSVTFATTIGESAVDRAFRQSDNLCLAVQLPGSRSKRHSHRRDQVGALYGLH